MENLQENFKGLLLPRHKESRKEHHTQLQYMLEKQGGETYTIWKAKTARYTR